MFSVLTNISTGNPILRLNKDLFTNFFLYTKKKLLSVVLHPRIRVKHMRSRWKLEVSFLIKNILRIQIESGVGCLKNATYSLR